MDTRDRIIRLTTFLLILILGFVLYRGLITPKRKGINSLKRNLQNIEGQIGSVLGEEVTLGGGAASEEQMEAFLLKLTKQIPSEKDIPQILNQFLNQVGKGLNVDYSLIQPQGLKPMGRYKKLPIELKFSTTYSHLNTYLTQLKSLPEVFMIDSMDMRRMPGQSDRLQVHLMVSAFVMPGGVEKIIQAITGEALPLAPQTSPFLPHELPKKPVTDKTPSAVAVPDSPAPSFNLKGILYGELKSAIVNDRLVYVGDLIDGYEVINIRENNVVLKKGRRIVKLWLDE
ncbi:type 4a pilus biogenesis protein PilO [Candidatus Margulisiibacteriota bacterium]